MDTLLNLIGHVAALLSLPGSLVLALWSLAALWPKSTPASPSPETGPLIVVVPAHNEQASIGTTVANLLAESQHDGSTTVCVVADNCTDHTAQLARDAGAQVLERTNDKLRGKGHALEFAFLSLTNSPAEWFIVVDADSQVGTGFLTAMRAAMWPDRHALQASYLSRPTRTLKGRLARFAQFGFNRVRPLGRECLGASVGLLGNGFALRKKLTVDVPYTAHSVVEDMEYHLKLVQSGYRVHYVAAAHVLGEIAESSTGASQQRARWEGGRLRLLREQTGPLAKAFLQGNTTLGESLAELLLLPLGLHVLLLGLATLGHGLVGAWTGALALCAYILAIFVRTPAGWRDLLALMAAPWYVLWKISMLPATLLKSRASATWVRAERAAEHTASKDKKP
jgi:cellulose synthase/poly-beta-1,6-N-acetylglucosamine synthase-like glycosyltransferase